MSVSKKYFPYRGDIQSLITIGSEVVFVTVHPEAQPTAINRLNLDTLVLTSLPLPTGGTCLASNGKMIWVGGSDGSLYTATTKSKRAKVLCEHIAKAHTLTALVLLSCNRLAVLAGHVLYVLNSKTGEQLQQLELPETGSCIATDPTGNWLVVGTEKGTVQVYDSEEKTDFTLNGSEKLHGRQVSALLFEPEELRFLSAGRDQKLLLTHARGQLEPEDRGRDNAHTDTITALVQTSGERFISGSHDKTCKTWLRTGGTKPATLSSGLGKVVDLAIATVDGRSCLVAACLDNSIRIFSLDTTGKFGEATLRIYDAYAMATEALADTTPATINHRQKSIVQLAEYADIRSLQLLVKHVNNDADAGLRLQATKLIGISELPLAKSLLEELLTHQDEAVRLESFHALCKTAESDDLSPVDMALQSGKANIALAAITYLEKLAANDDRAMTRLIQGVNLQPFEVRCAALKSIELLFEESPEADLIALSAHHADIRQIALKRFAQRDFLQNSRVISNLRKHLDDGDADVRQVAFQISLLASPHLATALRSRDEHLHRQLFEIETFHLPVIHGTATPKKKKLPKTKTKLPKLTEQDYEPLLQACASRAQDICAMGAYGLALLHDARALGTLLQLSRENDAQVRLQVCRALLVLDDVRATERLKSLLNDDATEVREAAFSALKTLYGTIASPKQKELVENFFEPALQARHDDIRLQVLRLLVKDKKKKLSKKMLTLLHQQLLKAVNNTAQTVRKEAFKTLVKVNTEQLEATFHSILTCHHADIRREIQTELMALSSQPWAWQLLLELLNDADPIIREETLSYCLKKTKGRDLSPLEKALESEYSDTVSQAVDKLVKKPGKQSQALLAKAATHSDREIHGKAITALTEVGANELLRSLITSSHLDIRFTAANALAQQGDLAALPVLKEQLNIPFPDEEQFHDSWHACRILALNGLALLSHNDGAVIALDLINDKHKATRKAAAQVLVFSCEQGIYEDELHSLLQHNDKEVKYRAALTLALNGDVKAMPLVCSKESIATPIERIAAAIACDNDTYLFDQLESSSENEALCAMVALLALEHSQRNGVPSRLLAMICATSPQFRLHGVQGLLAYATNDVSSYITRFINKGSGEWAISNDVVAAFCELIAHGEPRLRLRALMLAPLLFKEKPDLWNHVWSILSQRYGDHIDKLQALAQDREPVPMEMADDDMYGMVIGAYVGLAREQGGAYSRRERSRRRSGIIAIREAGLRGLMQGWQKKWPRIDAAKSVFFQALRDSAESVRMLALNNLLSMGVNTPLLAGECLETGFQDLGIKGLKLLTEGTDAKQGRKILEQAMVQRSDGLAIEAGLLLLKTYSVAEVGKLALQAISEDVRRQAIAWLAEDYEQPASQNTLRQALTSRYQDVREQAACALAYKKDDTSFDGLVAALRTAHHSRIFINALLTLGDKRAVTAFLDRLEDDPHQTANTDLLLQGVAQFRDTDCVPRLLTLLEKKEWRSHVIKTLHIISGYNQPIYEDDEGRPTVKEDWLTKQYPRHDEVLSQLMEKCLNLGELRSLPRFLEGARWSHSDAVNPILYALATHADDRLRNQVIEVLAWRAKHRKMPTDILQQSLTYKDEITRFLAAEALALTGNSQGLKILMTSIQLLSDSDYRQRAVLALGVLAEPASLDLLLTIASTRDHALQEVAAQAIGHLKNTEKGEAIFNLLASFVRSENWLLRDNAIKGLRWFDSEEGWKLVRTAATEDDDVDVRKSALHMLAFNSTPTTQDLILNILETPRKYYNDYGVAAALQSARILFGENSLLPDYAYARSGAELNTHILERLTTQGEPKFIFDLLPRCHRHVARHLSAHLLAHPQNALEAAIASLSSPHAQSVSVAAKIIAYTNTKQSIEEVLGDALNFWHESWREVTRNKRRKAHLPSITTCLETLLWMASTLKLAREQVFTFTQYGVDEPLFDNIRLSAWSALLKIASTNLSQPEETALQQALLDRNSEVRNLAINHIAQYEVNDIGDVIEQALTDRHSVDRLLRQPDLLPPARQTLIDAFANIHFQSTVTRAIIKSDDAEALSNIAKDGALHENVRLGAIESLVYMSGDSPLQILLELGKDETIDEDLRKAAWRSLRRLHRVKLKSEVDKI